MAAGDVESSQANDNGALCSEALLSRDARQRLAGGLPQMTLCGRDQEISRIVSDIKGDHFVVLSHEPGLGATVLMQEGLQPALLAEGFITLTWSDWQGRSFATDLKEAVADAVRHQADPGFFAETETLNDLMERVYFRTGRRVALLLDQFEDYLRCHASSHISDSFDAELAHTVSSHYAKCVVSLQQHSVGPLERLSQYIPNLLGHQVQLAPLTHAAAQEAILAEAARRSMDVEPVVVEALAGCQAAAFQRGVHPFFLMQGLKRLLDSESRLKSTLACQATLALNGGPDRLIMESLDPLLGDLNTNMAELLFRWCNILISPKNSRISVTAKALTDYAGKLNRFALTTLPHLQELGLLRTVEMPEVTRYEISRESLTPILHDWWQRRETSLTARRRAQFRVRSISVAVGSIVAIYAAWLLLGK